jgi:hypothetical protein
MIPLSERHLRRLLSEWVGHYNAGRPHSSLGPGIPAEVHRGSVEGNTICTDEQRKLRVISRPVLGGLHHEYVWEKMGCVGNVSFFLYGPSEPGEKTVTSYLYQTHLAP